MRLLIDECLPRQMKFWLSKYHNATTLRDMGWEGVKNGKLLKLANDYGFNVLITADKNMHYQQNFIGLSVSAAVIPSNFKPHVEKSIPALLQSLEKISPGQKVVLELGKDYDTWAELLLHSIVDENTHITHQFERPRA